MWHIKTANAGPVPFPLKSRVSYDRLHNLVPGQLQNVGLQMN